MMTEATYFENGRRICIRRPTAEGIGPPQVEVRIDGGEWARTYTLDHDPYPSDFEHAIEVARRVWGQDKKGRPACTNSMIHEIWDAMRNIAGC